MTSTTPGGLPRRSFLAAATAVGLVATSGLMMGAPSAAAATGANIEWHITSEPADAVKGYVALVNAIRHGVRSHEVRPEGGRPVSVTDAAGTSQFLTVDLHAEDRNEFIRLYLRRSDTYFMGWRQGTENGVGGVAWGSYFTLDANVALPGAIRTGTGANVNTRFEGRESYGALAQLGATRDGMQLSPNSLNNAVLRLQEGGTVDIRIAASAILQIIVGVAEASRFRNQAAATATAFGNGQAFTLAPIHIEQHNNWGLMSSVLLGAILVGAIALSPALEIGGALYETSVALAAVVMLAHHSGKNSGGKKLEGTTALVAPDGTGDYWTVQDAINAVPDYGANTIFIDKGTYHEVISIPSKASWLTVEGVSGNATDVIIWNSRAHGMINPLTGTKYSTQGSATATFRSNNLTVKNLTIANTFDPAAHPEVDPLETQAVSLAAMGDRHVYENVSILGRQDTLLCKGVTTTDQARQYFYKCFIRGTVDFIFGNATAVIDRSKIQMLSSYGATLLAPNTDYRKKYGILITHCEVYNDGQAPLNSQHLGRPWHTSSDARPQALVRNSVLYPHLNGAEPWIDMMPDYPWEWARMREYNNSGLGAGYGANAPKLTDAEALEYTARKYLAGTDGWNPVR